MKVSRDVILDLWPLYEAGEASADTRALIEQFLQDDPEFARQVRSEGGARALGPARVTLSPDHEMDTLRRIQQLLSYRQGALALAATFAFLAAYLRLGRWMVLGVAALCCLAWLGLTLFGRRLFRL